MSAANVVATVRYSGGTYIARGGGKTASCTMSDRAALQALGRKLFQGEAEISRSVTRENGSIQCVLTGARS